MLIALIAHLFHIGVAVLVGIIALRTDNRRLIFIGLFGLSLGAGFEYANALARSNMDQLYVVYSPQFIMDFSIANVPLLIPIGYFAYVGTVRLLALKLRNSKIWHWGPVADVIIAICVATAFETFMVFTGAWEWIAASEFSGAPPIVIGIISLFAVYLYGWLMGSILDSLLPSSEHQHQDQTESL